MFKTATIEGLWVDHQPAVRGFFLRRCSSADLADELTAETFLHAIRASDEGREITIGWLMTVAKRRLADHWRSSFRRSDLLERLQNERTVVERPDPSQDSDETLQDALMVLCLRQRTALTLRYCQDFSVQQVAEHMSLSYEATESVLARGRRGLARSYVAT